MLQVPARPAQKRALGGSHRRRVPWLDLAKKWNRSAAKATKSGMWSIHARTCFSSERRPAFFACPAVSNSLFKIMFIQRTPSVVVHTVDVPLQDLLTNAVNTGDLKKLQELLRTPGVDVNARNADGSTPLIEAVKIGEWNVVDMLMADGRVNVNIQDAEGYTALMYAAVSGEDSLEEFFELADDNDALVDLNLTNNRSQTALIIAAGGGYTDDIKLLLDRGAAVNIVDSSGSNALMNYIKAAFDGVDAETVQCFMSSGVNVNCQDEEGRTALMLFSGQFGRDAKGVFLQHPAVLDDVDMCDFSGNTALTHAVKSMDVDHFELLIEAGADVNIQVDGKSLISWARSNGYAEFVHLIDKVNADRNRMSDID